jgi:release factor glutamine methyltransferase
MREAMSARAVVAAAAARLAAAGIGEPRRDASRLWASVGGGAPALSEADAVEDVARAAAFEAAVERRAAGEPLAHIARSAGFRFLDLVADSRALIPRPETEGLVDQVLARVRTGRVADIGTGTGCIALSLASEGGFSSVVAVDRSPDALALARANVARVAGPVELVRGDLTSGLATASLDALVSNPPYLSDAEYAALDPAVRAWEPALALVSGPDGLDATTRLLDDGRRVLRRGGWLALEVDCSRAAEAGRRAAALGWADVAVFEDLFGRERYLLARRSDAS